MILNELKYKDGISDLIFTNKCLTDMIDYIAIGDNEEHLVIKDKYANSTVRCGFRLAKAPMIIPSNIVENYKEIVGRFKDRIVKNPSIAYY